jgi:hypothetical protein
MTLRSTLSVAANSLLCHAGAVVTPQTDPSSVRALIASLSPHTTDRPLIRLGPAGDGGYLVPDDLAEIGACFSPGVSLVSGFERECADRGMQVFLADASVPGPAEQHPNFHFTRKFLGVTTNATFMTLDDWVAASAPGPAGDLLLQIDIEGYEYEVFLAMSDALQRRLRIIVVEFHALEELWNRPWFGLVSRVFAKLAQTHACVHIHPNNSRGVVELNGLGIPCDAEFTFLRRDRIGRSEPATVFPHPLDHDCTSVPTPPLPACWIGATG